MFQGELLCHLCRFLCTWANNFVIVEIPIIVSETTTCRIWTLFHLWAAPCYGGLIYLLISHSDLLLMEITSLILAAVRSAASFWLVSGNLDDGWNHASWVFWCTFPYMCEHSSMRAQGEVYSIQCALTPCCTWQQHQRICTWRGEAHKRHSLGMLALRVDVDENSIWRSNVLHVFASWKLQNRFGWWYNRLGHVFGGLKSLQEPFWSPLGQSWELLGSSWAGFGSVKTDIERLVEALWPVEAVMDGFWTHFGIKIDAQSYVQGEQKSIWNENKVTPWAQTLKADFERPSHEN